MDDATAVTSAPSPAEVLGAEYLTEEQLAKFVRRHVRTVKRWAELRIGPPRITFQKLVLYRKSAVMEWLASHERRPLPRKRDRRPQGA